MNDIELIIDEEDLMKKARTELEINREGER